MQSSFLSQLPQCWNYRCAATTLSWHIRLYLAHFKVLKWGSEGNTVRPRQEDSHGMTSRETSRLHKMKETFWPVLPFFLYIKCQRPQNGYRISRRPVLEHEEAKEASRSGWQGAWQAEKCIFTPKAFSFCCGCWSTLAICNIYIHSGNWMNTYMCHTCVHTCVIRVYIRVSYHNHFHCPSPARALIPFPISKNSAPALMPRLLLWFTRFNFFICLEFSEKKNDVTFNFLGPTNFT